MWSSTFVMIIIGHFCVIYLAVLVADFDMFHVNFYIKVHYIMLPNFEKTPFIF